MRYDERENFVMSYWNIKRINNQWQEVIIKWNIRIDDEDENTINIYSIDEDKNFTLKKLSIH